MMTINIRERWFDRYRQLTTEAEVNRDSQSVAFGLLDTYDGLADSEKREVHEIFAEWFLSSDNKLRYDAGFITSQRRIVEMIPAVEQAIVAIGEPSGPEEKHELIKLNRIRDELKAGSVNNGH